MSDTPVLPQSQTMDLDPSEEYKQEASAAVTFD
jgi:hypothetical protein